MQSVKQTIKNEEINCYFTENVKNNECFSLRLRLLRQRHAAKKKTGPVV